MQGNLYLYYCIPIFLYIDFILLPLQNLISATHIQIMKPLVYACYIYRDNTSFSNIEISIINFRKYNVATDIISGYNPNDKVIFTGLMQYIVFLL